MHLNYLCFTSNEGIDAKRKARFPTSKKLQRHFLIYFIINQNHENISQIC